ncbi:MAG: hypothetical protein V4665_02225 [Patescibacteria group bacterium]
MKTKTALLVLLSLAGWQIFFFRDGNIVSFILENTVSWALPAICASFIALGGLYTHWSVMYGSIPHNPLVRGLTAIVVTGPYAIAFKSWGVDVTLSLIISALITVLVLCIELLVVWFLGWNLSSSSEPES